VIRQQMAETRASMTEKVEALEKQVAETVHETTETVSETVEAAKETVHETVEAVSDTVEAVKETFNLPGHFERHPWLAFGGSVAAGFALGMLLPSRRSDASAHMTSDGTTTPTPYQSAMVSHQTTPAVLPQATPEPIEPVAATPAQEKHPNLSDVLSNLKGLAIGTAIGLLGNVVAQSLPHDLRGNLTGLFNQLTEALGGKPVSHS